MLYTTQGFTQMLSTIRCKTAILISITTLWIPSKALAYDPFWGYHGWEIGAGTGPSYGGIVGGAVSYSLWRFEVGFGIGYLGASAWARLNLTVIADSLIPWVRGGLSPDPYAAFKAVSTHGQFFEGGASICSSPNPAFFCLEGALGAVWNISPQPNYWPVRPTVTLALTYHVESLNLSSVLFQYAY